MSIPRFLVASAALHWAGTTAAQGDARASLAAMKTAAAQLKSLHAIVRCEQRIAGKLQSTRFVECWIDIPRGRVRTELRDLGRASPKLVVVAGPAGLRIQNLEVDDIAALKRAFDLPTALAASFSGELLATAFRGDLLTFKAGAYGPPRLAAAAEKVGAVGCTRLTFGGNAEADLWIGELDQLPRRIRGPLPDATLEETIVRLELAPDLAKIEFEIAVPEGRRLPEPSEVRERWSRPAPEPERWIKPQEDAPDFAALDLDAQMHLLSETAEQEVVLAFWTPEDERGPTAAAEAEKAWQAAGGKQLFLHVAAGDEREPVATMATRSGLRQPVWVTGSHPADAFRAWRIWTCPVFARVSDMQVIAVTRDLDEVKRWLR